MTTVPTVNSVLLEERNEGTFYIGPLEVAKRVAASDRYIMQGPAPMNGWTGATGFHIVLLCDRENDPASAAEWGHGADAGEAWRWALGAYFGPLDAEYDEDALLSTLNRFEQHASYPHNPGYLIDCPVCESACHCTPGSAECVYPGEHNGTAS